MIKKVIFLSTAFLFGASPLYAAIDCQNICNAENCTISNTIADQCLKKCDPDLIKECRNALTEQEKSSERGSADIQRGTALPMGGQGYDDTPINAEPNRNLLPKDVLQSDLSARKCHSHQEIKSSLAHAINIIQNINLCTDEVQDDGPQSDAKQPIEQSAELMKKRNLAQDNDIIDNKLLRKGRQELRHIEPQSRPSFDVTANSAKADNAQQQADDRDDSQDNHQNASPSPQEVEDKSPLDLIGSIVTDNVMENKDINKLMGSMKDFGLTTGD